MSAAPPPRRGAGARSLLAPLPLLALALALCCCGGGARTGSTAASQQPSAGGFVGAALPAGAPVRGFTLTDQYGRRVSLASFRGRVTVLTFLYPGCGAPCILIAEQIRGALDELSRPVPVLIVSAEPAADSPAAVRGFLAQVSLSSRALYLSGSRTELARVWREFHVKPASAGRSAFESYASVLLLDRSGAERVLFQQEELTPEALAHDIRRLESS